MLTRRGLLMPAMALVMLLLVACGGAPTAPAPAAPAPTVAAAPAAEPTIAPAEPTTVPVADPATAVPEPTAALAEATAIPATGDLRVFRITPGESQASYAVQETFLAQNLPYRAIGTTGEIEGEFSFTTDGRPTGEVTTVTVNLPSLTSDDSRRDNRIRREWLESARFPLATFTSTEVSGVPESYREGDDVSFQLTGDMTIREVTRSVTFNVTGRLQGDTVTGTATTSIKMTDFGFNPPNIANFVAVEDDVEITVTFVAREAS
ncbi:MAG TPA: YceI family protein [Roseiflexaceae bacterium]|nr:YceI family protein [Roseiflexaceae bacterium]HMP41607.1 YceI family protein [Roseiflexaceae bacterium]